MTAIDTYTMKIEMTHYYPEFLRYFELAKDQQAKCNLGTIPYKESQMGDDLLENVELYDVVERKYAGFSQIVNDVFYGWSDEHPYWHKMKSGHHSKQRKIVATNWTGKQKVFGLEEWLYVFLLHRVCGSGINYSTKPSGYHNTLLFELHTANTIEDMVKIVKTYPKSFYTSVGYQFPAFPKPPPGSGYKRGGDYYLAEFAPRLVREFAQYLRTEPVQKNLRDLGNWLFDWNKKNDLRAYRFQYAAFIADVADWFPQYVNRKSSFYYGTNAVECISYLAKPLGRGKEEQFLDTVMERIYLDTGSVPYNAEDVCCDFIRWVENYVRPGADYDHLDRDKLWSSHRIVDHPYGRQKPMLELGLIKSFNELDVHPSDDYVLSRAGMTVSEYKLKTKELYGAR